jgi:rubrerythrin
MKHTTNPTDVGKNRTGAAASPVDSKRSVEGAKRFTGMTPSFSASAMEQIRAQYSSEAEPVGTMPPPASLKGAAATVAKAMKGEKATVFLDLLGERLAYERTGVRLYEALIAKLPAAGSHPQGPTRAQLEEIRDDELAHMALVKGCIERLGGDPTTVTPCADVTAVASSGVVKVLSDPRTTLTQCLKTMIGTEATDTDAWMMLADMAEKLGHEDMFEAFRDALLKEEEHLAKVRTWTKASLDSQAGLTPDDGMLDSNGPPPVVRG